MKKYIGALLFLLLLLTFGTVCAQSSGGCGENVSWELNDSVLSFTRKNESEDAIWNTNTGDSCKYVVKTSGATNVQIAGDGIKLGNGVDLFSDVCGEITELNLARLDTSEVTSLDNAFNGCAKVTQLNISGWATTKLTSVNSMFSGCSSLQVLDLSTLYLEGLSSWNGTFDNCTSINTFVFGANNKNIYGTLSDTIRTGAWYYKERSDVATDAYKIGTRVDAEGLFNNYVPSQMAGTWTTIAKAVTFDGNGDSNTKMGAQYFPSGLTLELKENEFKLEGYQFVNWNTAADGSGDTYTDCQKICPGTDLKLFAQWKIKNVTVSFIANGGEGTMAAQTVQADTATALNKNTFTRGGYIFTGWNTAADGSGTAYANGENITITDDLKLYAQWKDSTEPEPKPDHRPDFFRLWDDCELPATGFSSVRPTALSEQPKELRYEPVRMRLMLPTLDQDIELVTMPREGNSWTADWLGADAGILEGSALPGEGVSVIAAHNTLNDTQYGPFALLSTMETNDLIAVCSENGSLKIFRVYANELMRPDDMMRLAAFAGEEADPLVLVTCENESTEGGYLNRRVIFARPVR